ncbi:MAG TPA: RidA family protein [Anaerolineaceae bacterium]|nr:RidA family protein [Anaerolineaceae bacterium]
MVKNVHLLVSSGAPWEATVGYSRAVRVGNIIEVAGTTAVDERGEVVGRGDPYTQARFVIAKIEKALSSAGAGLQDVVRTRMFVTDISRWQEIGRAHGEAFAEIRPAATMVEVRALIEPDLLVEMEVTAVLPAG